MKVYTKFGMVSIQIRGKVNRAAYQPLPLICPHFSAYFEFKGWQMSHRPNKQFLLYLHHAVVFTQNIGYTPKIQPADHLTGGLCTVNVNEKVSQALMNF